MLITPHSLTGAAIASLIPNPFISVPLAIGSHFILDMIPHWQETLYPYKPTRATWIRLPIDLALSVGLVFWITQFHSNIATIIWIAAFTANIPDLDSVLPLIPRLMGIKFLKRYWKWHCRIQREINSLWGLFPQIILSFICLIFTKVIF